MKRVILTTFAALVATTAYSQEALRLPTAGDPNGYLVGLSEPAMQAPARATGAVPGAVRGAARAQDSEIRASVVIQAPIFIRPGAVTPLRVATVGTTLKVLQERGDWCEVEFRDPQIGPRVGWIETKAIAISRPDLRPMDLSIDSPPAAAAPDTVESAKRQINRVAAPSGALAFPAAETAISWSHLPATNLGWSFSGASNLTPWIGVVGDVSGYYQGFGTLDGGSNFHTFLLGARFTERLSGGRVNPFGQLLAGAGHTYVHAQGFSAHATRFMMQPGFGVDIGLSDAVALRVQADYQTFFSRNGVATQFRFAPGIVIRTGRKTL